MKTTHISHLVATRDRVFCWVRGDQPGDTWRQVVVDMPEVFDTASREARYRLMFEAVCRRFPVGRIDFGNDASLELMAEWEAEERAGVLA